MENKIKKNLIMLWSVLLTFVLATIFTVINIFLKDLKEDNNNYKLLLLFIIGIIYFLIRFYKSINFFVDEVISLEMVHNSDVELLKQTNNKIKSINDKNKILINNFKEEIEKLNSLLSFKKGHIKELENTNEELNKEVDKLEEKLKTKVFIDRIEIKRTILDILEGKLSIEEVKKINKNLKKDLDFLSHIYLDYYNYKICKIEIIKKEKKKSLLRKLNSIK